MAQFLLYDSPPDPAYAPSDLKYWDTFQTGLRFAGGRPKPALAAYQMPIWLPVSRVGRHGTLFVWGQLRPASSGTRERAAIQWRSPHERFRTLVTITTARSSGYLTARVRPPGSGELRILWRASRSRQLTSRSVAVSVA